MCVCVFDVWEVSMDTFVQICALIAQERMTLDLCYAETCIVFKPISSSMCWLTEVDVYSSKPGLRLYVAALLQSVRSKLS